MKIALLFAFTLCVFLVDTWVGMITFSALTLVIILASRVPLDNYFKVLVPVYMLMACSVVFNMPYGNAPLCEMGPLTLYADGLSRGCFFALRILLLCLASMIVSFTTTSTALSSALGWFIWPLRKLGAPVDDITTALSLALRFIPLLAQEVERAYDARWSRGAPFDGGLMQKLQAWGGVFLPVFVNLFRHGDRLSESMDARCYGIPGVKRTTLDMARPNTASLVALVGGLLILAVIAAPGDDVLFFIQIFSHMGNG